MMDYFKMQIELEREREGRMRAERALTSLRESFDAIQGVSLVQSQERIKELAAALADEQGKNGQLDHALVIERGRFARLSAAYNRSQETIAGLEDRLKLVIEQRDRVDMEVRDLRGKVLELEHRIKLVSSHRNDLENKVQKLEAELKKAKDETDLAYRRACLIADMDDSHMAEIEELEAHIRGLEATLRKRDRRSEEATLNMLRAKITLAEQKIEELEAEKRREIAQAQEYHGLFFKAAKDAEEAQERIRELEKDAKADVGRTNEALGLLVQEVENTNEWAAKAQDLEGRLFRAQQELVHRNAEVRDLKARILELAEVRDLKARILEQEADRGHMIDQIRKLQDRLRVKAETIYNLEASLVKAWRKNLRDGEVGV